MQNEITISKKTIIFGIFAFFGTIFGIYLVYLMGPVLFILVMSMIIVISMETPIKFFMRFKLMNKPLSRSLAVLMSYFISIIVVLGVITLGFPPVISQAQKLLVNLTATYQDVIGQNLNFSLTTLLPNLSNISSSVFTTTYSVLVNIAAFFSVMIVSIYMSLDWDNLKRRFLALFSKDLKDEVKTTIEEIEISIGHWVKGQIILMVIIGLISFAGLVILDIEYPLALSLIAGLLEIVPMLGPVVALVIAGIVGFSSSVVKGLLVIGLFTIIQQVENNYLVPKVMHRVSGFSPLVILIALLIGSTLFGVLGAIIAVPVMMIGVIILKHAIKHSNNR